MCSCAFAPAPAGAFFILINLRCFAFKTSPVSKFDLVTKKQATKGCLFCAYAHALHRLWLVSLGYSQRNLAIFPINIEDLEILPLVESKDLLGVNVTPFA